MPSPRSSGEDEMEMEMESITFLLPKTHKAAIQEEAFHRSTPQKQVPLAEVARSIIDDWYKTNKKTLLR